MLDTDASIVRDLRYLVPGLSVYLPESPEFRDSQDYYNSGLPNQPLATVLPRTEDEVLRVVEFCTTAGIMLAVRSGGHDFFGRSVISGGILIDMRAMDSIQIAPDRASARVGGGVIAGALQRTLDSHHLFTPTGQAKTVGYVSWACGGGYGFYVGTYGFGVDQILGARVAVANGKVVDTDEDPELLWAIRGTGAGTFGIVTELRVKVYPSPKLYAGYLAFPLSDAAEVFSRFEELLADGFPDEFSGDAIVVHPEMLPIPVSEPSFTFLWCWTAVDGDLTPAKRFLHRMTQLGSVLANTVTETTAAAYGVGDSSSATFFRSRNIEGLQANVGNILARCPPPQPLSAVIVHNNHGKGVRNELMDGIGAAFPNRYQHIILGLHGGTKSKPVTDAQAVSEAIAWVRELEHAMDKNKIALEGGFPSFFPPGQVDIVQFFGEQTLEKLRQLKNRLDPENVFCKGLPRLS